MPVFRTKKHWQFHGYRILNKITGRSKNKGGSLNNSGLRGSQLVLHQLRPSRTLWLLASNGESFNKGLWPQKNIFYVFFGSKAHFFKCDTHFPVTRYICYLFYSSPEKKRPYRWKDGLMTPKPLIVFGVKFTFFQV